MSEDANKSVEQEETKEAQSFFIGIAVGIVILTILLVAGAVLLAVFADEAAAEVEIIRDILIVAFTLELITVAAAIVVFLMQLARFVNLLSNEIQPIIESTTDTVNTVRGTAAFISKNLTEPIMSANATLRTIKKTMGDVEAIKKAAGIAMSAAATAVATPTPEHAVDNSETHTAEKPKKKKKKKSKKPSPTEEGT